MGYGDDRGFNPPANELETLKVGNIPGGNYFEIESDGTAVSKGDATTWDDFTLSATQARRGALSKPDFDYTNLGLLFPQNDTSEEVYLIMQMPHKKKMNSKIYFHIHYIQSVATQPTFTIEYKFYKNGTAVPASWTTLNTSDAEGNKGVFPYTSGSIMQIAIFPAITPPADETVSANFELKIYRNDNDVTGDVLVKYFDFHLEIDTDGSREQFSK